MSELKVNKTIILPDLSNIKDPEAKRIMQSFAAAIEEVNQSLYNAATYFDEKIEDLEGA